MARGSAVVPRMAERIVDVLIPLIIEEIVEIVKAIFQERISERIREQVVDVHVPGAVEQVTEVPKTSNLDRNFAVHSGTESSDVPVPEMARQLVEAPETVSQDRIRQRTVEQIVDAPFPQVCGRTGGESPRFSPRTGFNSALLSRSFLLLHSLR